MAYNFNQANTLKDKTKRFLGCSIGPIIKFSILSGAIFYIKENSNTLLIQYFNLTTEKTKAALLLEHLKKIGSDVSLLSPSSISNYLSNATTAFLAEAKVTYLEKSISLSTMIINGILSLAWFYLIYKLIFSIIDSYKEKDKENEFANLIVQKILPIMKEDLNKKLDN